MSRTGKKPAASRIALWIVCGFIALWLIAPTLVVIPLSFTADKSLAFPPRGVSLQWYENFFTHPQWIGGLLNSIQIALLVGIIALVLGTLAAYGLSKTSGFAKAFSNGALILPMLVPAVAFGVGVYAIFLRTGLVGTLPGFLIAHTVLALPYVVVNVGAVLSTYDSQLERAAWISGAGKVKAFFTVTLPNLRTGLFSGFLFAFITSFDEVVVSMFIQSPYLQTLPVRMYSSIQREVDPTIAAAATVIMVITTVAALLAILPGHKRKKKIDA